MAAAPRALVSIIVALALVLHWAAPMAGHPAALAVAYGNGVGTLDGSHSRPPVVLPAELPRAVSIEPKAELVARAKADAGDLPDGLLSKSPTGLQLGPVATPGTAGSGFLNFDRPRAFDPRAPPFVLA